MGRGMKGVGICAAAVLLLCGCSRTGEQESIVVIEHETEEIAYQFTVAERGDVVKTEKMRCIYRQTREQEVSFPVSGRVVDRVYVKEGERVKKGDILLELSSEDLERQIEDLEYAIARNELLLGYTEVNESYAISGLWVNYLYNSGMSENDKKNLDKNIESLQRSYRYQREDYSDALEADRQELEQLKSQLSSSRVYAELDGVVYKLERALEGSTSQQGKVVMTIADTSECLFEASAPELAEWFREGETVEMTITAGTAAGDYLVLPRSMEAWGDTQLFAVYEGPENAEIEVGTYGTIQVVTDSREDVLSVDSDAVFTADGRSYVYVLGEDNMREVRWVETGLYGDDRVEIISGLAEGEKVIRR